MSEPSDEELITAYLKGDMRAFEMFYQRHKGPMFRYLLSHVNESSTAEELLQDTFMRVTRSAASHRGQSKVKTWMYTIARNLCIDHYRRNRHRRHLPLDDPSTVAENQAPTPDAALAHQAAQQRIASALGQLPPDQYEVFVMREQAGLSFREIAAVLECPEGTVKSRMRYALNALRDALADLQSQEAAS